MSPGWVYQGMSSSINSPLSPPSILSAGLILSQTHSPGTLPLGPGPLSPLPNSICQTLPLLLPYPCSVAVTRRDLTLPLSRLLQEHYQPRATLPTTSLLWRSPVTSLSDTG